MKKNELEATRVEAADARVCFSEDDDLEKPYLPLLVLVGSSAEGK
jgi:hypothetical protein